MNQRDEKREKRRVTLLSLATAVILIIMKVAVGLKTGYLTLITEALHSSLDALVTVVTFFSVRYAEQPEDLDHPYGHGKAENLAAFTESILLFFALGFILKEMIQRVFVASPLIVPSPWPVIVLLISIGLDINRSRSLKKIARKYKSPAIEADAVHFSADFITSGIALVGMAAAYILAKTVPLVPPWVVDIVTTGAIIVIVTRMVIGILARAMQVLLDRTAPENRELIRDAVSRIPDVIGVEQIRTREAGKKTFVDLTVGIDRNLTLESSCKIRTSAERAIKECLDNADVVLQLKPVMRDTEGIAERIQSIATRQGLNVHHITVHNIKGVLHVDMDLEVDGAMKLAEAHSLADLLEAQIRKDNPRISEVNTHVEWRKQTPVEGTVVTERHLSVVRTIEQIVKEKQGVLHCRRVSIEEEESGEIVVTVCCTMAAEESGADVHKVSEEIERTLRETIQESSRVIIHVEPETTDGTG